jgi:uncharacterized membrane protein required for colicin V production
MNSSLEKLPINLFDLMVLVMLMAGIYRGRKHGMSEQLINLLQWVTIVFGCAAIYQWGSQLFGEFTGLFTQLTRYIMVYVTTALLIVGVFALVKRALGGKLVGSDIFGKSEYYLGMVSGVARAACILLVGLALLNARYFSPAEVRAMQKYNDDLYGSDFFPGLHSVQESVFEKSLTGPWIRQNLGFLLIRPTEPENKEFHQKEYKMP